MPTMSGIGTSGIDTTAYRLTQFAHGGGCACKIPPGELEQILSGLVTVTSPDLLVGLEHGDDAAVVRVRDVLPMELLREVLRGGLDVGLAAGAPIAGGHSIDDPEPKYGLAVTGVVDPERILRNDAARPGLPLSLTKPLGVGVLNNRHKATGERFPQAVASMVALNDTAARHALEAGAEAATDVTGFGLLGHLFKMVRASGVSAVVDAVAVPYLEGAREALRDGFVSGGTRRNLEWVRPQIDSTLGEDELLLLADAQTSGGLLVVGEIPGAPIVGEIVPRRQRALEVR